MLRLRCCLPPYQNFWLRACAETSSVSNVFIARCYLRSNAQNRHPFHHLPFWCSFAVYECMGQGRNEGGKGNSSPVVESPWGPEITAWGAERNQQCHKYFLQYSAFASERPQVRTWGRQTL